jgi:D-arabinose 1-dehydrogenase-like Zn-dependent alcohol dehydrogenase
MMETTSTYQAVQAVAPGRNSSAKPGDLVAVLGIGGLGHLGVQYARHMGFEVAAIARGADKAKKLGAHHYIDSAADIVRFEDGKLAEHWDVLQNEATKAQSTSGLPMFGDRFPG